MGLDFVKYYYDVVCKGGPIFMLDRHRLGLILPTDLTV